jgi:hypothetical protein
MMSDWNRPHSQPHPPYASHHHHHNPHVEPTHPHIPSNPNSNGQMLSPATATGGSIKSPMTIGFPALDDIVSLHHVRHLLSLFFVHVSLFS